MPMSMIVLPRSVWEWAERLPATASTDVFPRYAGLKPARRRRAALMLSAATVEARKAAAVPRVVPAS